MLPVLLVLWGHEIFYYVPNTGSWDMLYSTRSHRYFPTLLFNQRSWTCNQLLSALLPWLQSFSSPSIFACSIYLQRIYLPLFRKCLLIFQYQEVSLAYFMVLCQDNRMKKYFSSSQKEFSLWNFIRSTLPFHYFNLQNDKLKMFLYSGPTTLLKEYPSSLA